MNEPQYGNMKINMFFKKGTDVGAIADSLLDMNPNFTAFNDAHGYKSANRNQLYIASSHALNLFTDYQTFITIDPLSSESDLLSSAIVSTLAVHEDFTLMNAEELVIKL